MSLVPYVEERQAYILAALKLSPDLDLRFVDSKPLAFAGWKGALAMGVKSLMPPPGDYGVYTGAGDERLDVVVAALEGILPAGAVTKAVR